MQELIIVNNHTSKNPELVDYGNKTKFNKKDSS